VDRTYYVIRIEVVVENEGPVHCVYILTWR
jgi:hypothetical protein